ncbi:hypothetical protein ABPG75_011081 [Micractinium tetrahymenae]
MATIVFAVVWTFLAGTAEAAAAAPFPWLDTGLSDAARVDALLGALSPQQKVAMLQTDPFGGFPELAVPDVIWQAECSHGVKLGGAGEAVDTESGNGGTIYPQNLAQAAAFDDALIRRMAAEIAAEMRAMHNMRVAGGQPAIFTHCLSPHVAIVRDPRWGRLSETWGEDPLLQTRLAVAFVRGLQGGARPQRVAVGATCKHFLGHDIESFEGHTCWNWDFRPDPRDLRDTFLPHFQACVAEAQAVMCAFNAVNGTPSCASEPLLTGLLRGQLGFDGFVVTDNRVLVTSTTEPPTGLGFAGGNLQNASMLMVQSGVDMFMKTSERLVPADLAPAELDAAAGRLLMARMRQGHFDPPESLPWAGLNTSVIGRPQHAATGRELTVKGSVLLKNAGGTLPLDPARLNKLAVIGPFSDTAEYLLGRNYGASAGPIITPLAALRAALPGAEVSFNPATAYVYSEANAEADAQACEAADACVLFLGSRLSRAGPKSLETDDELPENSYLTYMEGEGMDRESLLLQAQQTKLWQALAAATSKPLVVVLVHGGPLDISDMLASPRVGAILSAWIPGQHGALGIADLLLGKAVPSGRTPLTWYRDSYVQTPLLAMTDLRMRASGDYPGRTYRYWKGEAGMVLFPFGHGLSYVNFTLANASVAAGANGTATAAVTVTHAGGSLPADTAVLLFLSYLGPTADAAAAALPQAVIQASGCAADADSTDLVQRLAGYSRTAELAPGGAQQLEFGLQLGGGSSSSWAGFGDPEPPCGVYGLRFLQDQPLAAVVSLA